MLLLYFFLILLYFTYKGVFNFMDVANEEIEYEYDKNGNLVKDLNKNISKIEYNLLNLPSKITFGDGKTITYVYDASGVKLLASYKTAHPASSHTIAYCGNMIYEDDTFKQVLFDGGYITFTDNRAMYHYYLKDHLGNNRVVVSSKGEVEQVNHYYPYGGIMAESTNESVQRYFLCGHWWKEYATIFICPRHRKYGSWNCSGKKWYPVECG